MRIKHLLFQDTLLTQTNKIATTIASQYSGTSIFKHISESGEVVFGNGFSTHVDYFIFCTGICALFSFLSGECEVYIKEDELIVTPL